jgi:2-C-methyl-D-erythritol 4-phosphate cytidylyltransferase
MNADVPKQYLPLAGGTVIEWALAPLLAHPGCAGIAVALARDDQRWATLAVARDARIRTTVGGGERAESVLAGLRALSGLAAQNDWVLVHDAARPCLSSEDLQRLIEAVRDDEVGGLLATPVVDTLKRSDADKRVLETVARAALWRALTPQMFRYAALVQALTQAAERGVAVTDEAQAIEMLGLHPRLVAGDTDNIKITMAADLQRAQQILLRRKSS